MKTKSLLLAIMLICFAMLYSCGNKISNDDMKVLIKAKVKNCVSVTKVYGDYNHYVAVDSAYNMYIFDHKGNQEDENGEAIKEKQ